MTTSATSILRSAQQPGPGLAGACWRAPIGTRGVVCAASGRRALTLALGPVVTTGGILPRGDHGAAKYLIEVDGSNPQHRRDRFAGTISGADAVFGGRTP